MNFDTNVLCFARFVSHDAAYEYECTPTYLVRDKLMYRTGFWVEVSTMIAPELLCGFGFVHPRVPVFYIPVIEKY